LDHLTPSITDTKLLTLFGRILEVKTTPESISSLRLSFYQPGFSWQELVNFAVAQEVLPPFILALNERGLLPPVPAALPESARLEHVTSRLAAAYQQHLERQECLREQLFAILSTLNRAGVVPVLLKGAMHLTQATPRWHKARGMRDLDILVPTCDAEKSKQLLLSEGYVTERVAPPIDQHLPELHLPNGAGAVELHVEALAFPARHALTTDEVWMLAEQRSFGGGSARTLPAEWHMFHGMLNHQLADHGHARRLLTIKGLWEFTMVGSQLSPNAWHSLIDHAKRRDIVDILASWVIQANRLFNLPIPHELEISSEAYKHAVATFKRACAPFAIRRALFVADKLLFGFNRETLAVRYGSIDTDGLGKTALRHLMFLLRRHGHQK
jgi:hypothetical protein